MEEEFDVDHDIKIIFHGVEYYLHLIIQNNIIIIDCETNDQEHCWSGEFTQQYIEEVTRKTGNYKRFSVFVKMLISAITTQSGSVFVDLLTYSDLDLLRNRNKQPPTQTIKTANNKRYLILTYAVEYDKIHYPLPLNYISEPNNQYLLRLLRRLKKEVSIYRKYGIDDKSMNQIESVQKNFQKLKEETSFTIQNLKSELQKVMNENKELKLTATSAEDIDNYQSIISDLKQQKKLERDSLQKTIDKLKQENIILGQKVISLEQENRSLKSNQTKINTYTAPKPYSRSSSRSPKRNNIKISSTQKITPKVPTLRAPLRSKSPLRSQSPSRKIQYVPPSRSRSPSVKSRTSTRSPSPAASRRVLSKSPSRKINKSNVSSKKGSPKNRNTVHKKSPRIEEDSSSDSDFKSTNMRLNNLQHYLNSIKDK